MGKAPTERKEGDEDEGTNIPANIVKNEENAMAIAQEVNTDMSQVAALTDYWNIEVNSFIDIIERAQIVSKETRTFEDKKVKLYGAAPSEFTLFIKNNLPHYVAYCMTARAIQD